MKPHRTDGVSLTFAILMFGAVTYWLVDRVVDVGLPKAGWLAAGALILFGVLGLFGTLRAGRSGRGGEAQVTDDWSESS